MGTIRIINIAEKSIVVKVAKAQCSCVRHSAATITVNITASTKSKANWEACPNRNSRDRFVVSPETSDAVMR